MEKLFLVTDNKGNEMTFQKRYHADVFVKSAKENYKKYLGEDVDYKIEEINLTKY